MYRSDREIPLVFQEWRQATLSSLVLTVESYIKWYSIIVVFPSGNVAKLPKKIREEYESTTGNIAWSDHVPIPNFCEWIVENYLQYEWDQPSLDMIYGRWYRQQS